MNLDVLFRRPRAAQATKVAEPQRFDPNVDLSLPYLVACDHAILSTHDSDLEAVAAADRFAQVEPFGDRVMVTFCGIGFYSTSGHHNRPPLGKAF